MTDDAIIAAYAAGRSIHWLQKKAGVQRRQIVAILEAHGVTIRSHSESMAASWQAMTEDEREAAVVPLQKSAKTRKRKKRALTKRIFGLLTNEHYDELRAMCEDLGETQHEFVRRAVLRRMRTRRQTIAAKKRRDENK